MRNINIFMNSFCGGRGQEKGTLAWKLKIILHQYWRIFYKTERLIDFLWLNPFTLHLNQMLTLKEQILRHDREGKVRWFVIATLDGNWSDSLRWSKEITDYWKPGCFWMGNKGGGGGGSRLFYDCFHARKNFSFESNLQNL